MRRFSFRVIALTAVVVALAFSKAPFARDAGQVTGGWTAAGALLATRAGAAAALLQDGRLLISGGRDSSGVLASSEILDPNTGSTLTAAMNVGRAGHTATALPDGRVLVTGGTTADGTATAVAEIFTGAGWTSVAMVEARTHHSATLLSDGRVLIVGGDRGDPGAGNPLGVSQTAEIFDPNSNTFAPAGTLSSARTQHAAAILPHDRVIVGGGTTGAQPLATTEILDVTTGATSSGPQLSGPRVNLTATDLLNGDVLFVGGNDGGTPPQAFGWADRYSPATGQMTGVGGLGGGREGHVAIRLPDNNGVLIAGGTAYGQPLQTAEIFLPASGLFQATNPTEIAHAGAILSRTAVSGTALIAGGTGTAAVEKYRFATITTDKGDYAPGETVTITGTGWVPGETVTLSMVESPLLDEHPLLPVVADADGNFISTEFAPDEHDVDIRFYLTAYGSLSEAQNTFTDARNWTLTFAGTGSGSVVITPNTGTVNAPVSCGGTGGDAASQTVTSTCALKTTDNGATVTFSATATTGVFGGWSGQANLSSSTCSGTTNPCSAVLGSSAALTVTFSANPPPTTTSISPASKSYGDAGFAMTVNGTGFNSNSVVRFAGSNRTTTFVSATQLTATIPASDLLSTGNFNITVFNPAPGGGTSNPQTFSVNKATATVVVTPYTVTYDGQPHTATVTSITGVNGETGATVGTVSVTNTTHTSAGTYSSDSWTFTGTANYNNISSTTITDTINKAAATVVVTPYTVTYNGQPHTAAITSITGVNGETGATVGTVDVTNTTHTNAATYATDSWTFTGGANYNNQGPTTITDTIGKANATFTVTPYNVTYNGQSHTATVSTINGVNGETGATVGTVNVSNTTHTSAGTYNTDSWSFTGGANYNNQGPTTITDTIGKAEATFTVTPYNLIYNGQAHTATVSAITGVNGETGATVGAVDVSGTTHTNAGMYNTDSWSFTGGANYNNQGPTTITDTISKAEATFTVTPYSVTYNGQPHAATVSAITGVNGETGATVGAVDVSGTTHTNAGTYNTDTWSFTGGANYNNQGPTTITDTIAKAAATFTVTPYNVTYNGQAHTATVSAITGVNGETGATVGAVDVTNTTHTNAATYATDSWSFTGGPNYNNQGPTTISDAIGKADATFTVTPYSVTYNGQAHTATVSAIAGVNGETGATVGTVDVTGTTHTNAATYATDTWTFTGGANYNNQGPTTITDAIGKAEATFTVTPYSVTYNGQAHTATVSAITGVNGETGATVGTVNVTGTTHTNAATYATDTWTFTGGANYNNQGPTTITDSIGKADATFTVTPYTVTYNGQPHTATVSAITGVNGETGATVGTVDVTGTTHTNAATYATDTWTFTGGANYNNQGPTTITDAIGKAEATFTVTPYSVTYNGQAHTATVSAIAGVNGETGATVGAVNVTNTTHTNAGTYASDSWTFTGGPNYNNQGPTTITDTIGKADATFTVTPYTVTYNGQPHTATVSAITGVNGEAGATVGTVDVTNTTHTNAATYASDTWTFTGTANYNNQGPTTITDTIGKADASFTVTPYTVTYNGQPHTATVSTITGVNGETGATVGTVGVTNTTHTNAATYASDTWTFTGGANYNNQGPTTITDTIGKAEATFTVTPYTVTYNGQPHTATVSAITGVNGETGATVGTVDVSGTTHTNAGTYSTDTWSFTGTGNYNNQGPTTITDTIGKADATFTVTPYTVTYNGQPHTATVSAITGVNGETGATVGTVDVTNTTHTNAATYATDTWSFTGGANYNNQGPTTITDTISKADATFTVTPYNVTYNGQAHTASVTTITGVNGEIGATVGTVDVSGTTHTNAATYNTDTWSFTGTGNYNSQGPTTITDTIGKADATFTVTPYTATYNGQPHTATVSAITGVNGETGATVGTVDVTNTAHTSAATYATDSWTFTGGANYNNQGPTTITNTIGKADATFTVTPYTATYNGQPHTATVSAITGVNGETGATVGTVDVTNTTHTSAATYATDTWSFTGGANYNNQGPTTITDTIGKADASFTVTPYTATYNGQPHAATVSAITGVNGETGATVGTVDVTNTTHTNAATYATDTWSFTGGANYNNQGPTPITDTIGKADATIVVTGFSGPFDGLAHGVVSSSATGVTNEALTGLAIAPTTYTNVPGGSIGWTFTNANYADQSGTATVTLTAASTMTTVSCPAGPFTYTGAAQTPCSAMVTGTGLDAPVTVTYSNNINAGTATASATYAATTNYQTSSDSKDFTIGKAAATIVVTGFSGLYDTLAHGVVSSSATGVTSEALAGLVIAPTTYTNVPGGSIGWTFTNANYANQSGNATVTITPASTTTTVTCPASQTYTGLPLEPCSVSVTGTDGYLATDAASYSDNSIVGTASATFSYAGDTNHSPSTDTKTFAITLASSTTTVTCTAGPFIYTGAAQTPCLVSVTGAGGLNLTPAATYADNTNVGTASASYHFTGDANHTGSSDSKTFAIGAATSLTSVTCTAGPFTYTGAAQTPCSVRVTGANLNLSPAPHYANNVNAGLATASYAFSGDANHSGSNGSANFTIGRAPTTTSAGNVTAVSSGSVQNVTLHAGVTGSVVNEGSVTFTITDLTDAIGVPTTCAPGAAPVAVNNAGASCTLPAALAVGVYHIHAVYSGGPNYFGSSSASGASAATLTITPAALTSDVASVDADFKHIDGFDVLFGKQDKTVYMKLKNTNPGTFHFVQTLVNETGVGLHPKNVPINEANGGTVTALITIPALPGSVGTPIPASAQALTNLTRSAFVSRDKHSIEIHPDDRTDDIVKDEMIEWTTYAPGGNCADSSIVWTAGQPADNTRIKCLRISGFAIPKHGKAKIQVNLEFAAKDTTEWDANAQLLFRAGFVFRTTNTITLDPTFPIASLAGTTYQGSEAVGLVGAGQKVTAVGGFLFDGATMGPIGGAEVRLFDSAAPVSACGDSTNVIGSTITLADGFYFIWNTGSNQTVAGGSNTLPDGVRYVVQVCGSGGGPELSRRTLANKLGKQEFEEEDFYIIFP